MSKQLLVIFGTVIVALIAIAIFFTNKNDSVPEQTKTVTQPATEEETKQIEGYTGNVLAGEKSPYLEFNKKDYEKALSDNKVILLDFYANWCPICRTEASEIKAGFDSLTTDQVIGFRVNYNDRDTDEDEKALAKQFEIAYQHTKVILKNGEQVLKSPDAWDNETFDKEIGKFL